MKYQYTRSFIILLLAAVTVLLGAGRSTAAKAQPQFEPDAPAAGDLATVLYLPAVLTPRTTQVSDEPIFGVQMYNDSGPTSPYFSSLVDSGASWLRVSIYWFQAEGVNVTPDQYEWFYADRAVGIDPSGAADMKIIGTIEKAPGWAIIAPDKPDSPIKTENLPDFLEFVAATVERFDGDGYQDAPGSPVVDYWEFYNEPDRRLNTGGGRWGNHPAEYAHMLSLVYPVVKAQNPDAQVVLGGLAYDFFDDQGGAFIRSFLDNILAAGAGNYFDIFNFHAYPSFAVNWLPAGVTDGGSGLLQKADYLRAKLNAAGLNKPMIITEAGWHSNNPPNSSGSEEIQARYVAQLYVQSLAADIDVMIWWMLNDPGGGGWDNGLVTIGNPPRRKLSFLAHQTIVDVLTNKPFVRALPATETGQSAMEAYQFDNPITGLPFYAAWLNPVETGASTPLSIAAEEAHTRDIYGAVGAPLLDESDGADDGRVTVPITGRPVYIEVIR